MKKYSFALLWIPWAMATEVINNIVVFGDSYSDVGNSQRLTNGPVWSEDLAVGWNASLYSFAFSGAVCNNEYYEAQEEFIPSVTDQVEMYYKQGLNLNVEETAIIFWIGMNDIYQIFKNSTENQDIKLELKRVVDCIGNNMRNIRKVFSANKFIVFGVPPLERMPYYANTNLSGSRERAANQLNELLTKEVEKMNKHSQHLELDLVDVHKLLDDIVDNPELFGLKNANESYWDICQGKCSEEIDSYVWWDKTHLTGGVHRLIANSILMAGSLASETYLDDELDVGKLLHENSIYQSPVYKAQKSTGEIEKVIERLKEEKEDADKLPKEDIPSSSPPPPQEQKKSNSITSTKSYLYFGITATLIVAIAFILFIKTKRRGNHLAALSGLIHKPDSRGRFLPLHNMDSSNNT